MKPLSPVVYGDSDEQRAFDFFKQNTAPQFAGQHELAQRFWNHFIPQSALNDPLIYQMAVAMGSRHEATALGSVAADELATKHHAAVMSNMARNLHSMSVDASLLCCCMLMGYANLCEEVPATAAIHFSLGLKMLRERGNDPTIFTDSMCAFIEPMFSELELGTVLFAVPAANVAIMGSARPIKPDVLSTFEDLYQAKRTLADILRWRLYVMIEYRNSPALHLTLVEIDFLIENWRQKVVEYSLLVAADHPGLYLKARKMLFQYKLFGMCKGAASNGVFVDACRVHMLSVDFSQPHTASILCTYLKKDAIDNNWEPLAPEPTRRLDEDDLDIWPQGERMGHDASTQIVRIVLGR